MKIKSYYAPRTSLLVSGAFCLVGSFPRLMGILTPKPEYVETMRVVDALAVVWFGISVLWAIYTISHNARIRMIQSKGTRNDLTGK